MSTCTIPTVVARVGFGFKQTVQQIIHLSLDRGRAALEVVGFNQAALFD